MQTSTHFAFANFHVRTLAVYADTLGGASGLGIDLTQSLCKGLAHHLGFQRAFWNAYKGCFARRASPQTTKKWLCLVWCGRVCLVLYSFVALPRVLNKLVVRELPSSWVGLGLVGACCLPYKGLAANSPAFTHCIFARHLVQCVFVFSSMVSLPLRFRCCFLHFLASRHAHQRRVRWQWCLCRVRPKHCNHQSRKRSTKQH